MTQEDRFLHKVRLLQRKTKCSNTVCNQFVSLFKRYSNESTGRGLQSFDTKAKRAAGLDYLVLHGCPGCKKYVYRPGDVNVNCPFVKLDGTVCGQPRYDESNKPREVSLMMLCVCVCVCVFFLVSLMMLCVFFFVDAAQQVYR